MGKEQAVSRRAVAVATSAGAALAAAAVATPAPASAAGRRVYRRGSYTATKVLSAADRHLVNRFSYGVTPALTAEVLAAGGATKWIAAQAAMPYDPDDGTADWWPDLNRSPAELWVRQSTGVRKGYRVSYDYGKRLLMRRILGRQQVREVMTEFWESHLHVPANDGAQFTWRAEYGEVIRRHALGRFDQMLRAAVTHPAMLIFLDNASSTATHPNENLARELLELHTVGVGAYTEDDVKDSARILTGWRVVPKTWAAYYSTADHATGRVTVLGFTDPNDDTDGRLLTDRYLTYLARHERTAQRIARRLAVKFVSDTPSAALVNKLAKVYLDNDTAIIPVVAALMASPEFLASADLKLRDPGEDLVATHRILGTTLAAPADPDDTAAANSLVGVAMSMGPAPMGWPRPDGAPIDNASWSSPARVMGSCATHWQLGGGYWPTNAITYRARSSWVPARSMLFRDLVDHLARTLHGRASTSNLLKACCEATGAIPLSLVTPTSSLTTQAMPKLLAVFLDHPAHLFR